MNPLEPLHARAAITTTRAALLKFLLPLLAITVAATFIYAPLAPMVGGLAGIALFFVALTAATRHANTKWAAYFNPFFTDSTARRNYAVVATGIALTTAILIGMLLPTALAGPVFVALVLTAANIWSAPVAQEDEQ